MAAGDLGFFMNNNDNFMICPTCKGKGFCESNEVPRNISSPIKGKHVPKISPPRKIHTPTLVGTKAKDVIENKVPLLPDKISPVGSKNCFQSSLINSHKPGSRGNMSETSELVADLIGHEEVDNPVEFAKIVKARLSSKEWSDRVLGMQNAVHLSRVSPETAIEIGRIVCRTILDELNSLRSRCVRVACQAAKELFQLGGELVYRPVFDEIVNVLMGRAADSKRVIREDADDALMSIASYCPVQHVARAFSKGPKHRHQLVRKSSLRLLKVLINRIGLASLMRSNNYKDVRNALLVAGCILLADPIAEIRNTAKEIMTPVVKTPEFENAIHDIDQKYFKQVENVLFKLKYKLEER